MYSHNTQHPSWVETPSHQSSHSVLRFPEWPLRPVPAHKNKQSIIENARGTHMENVWKPWTTLDQLLQGACAPCCIIRMMEGSCMACSSICCTSPSCCVYAHYRSCSTSNRRVVQAGSATPKASCYAQHSAAQTDHAMARNRSKLRAGAAAVLGWMLGTVGPMLTAAAAAAAEHANVASPVVTVDRSPAAACSRAARARRSRHCRAPGPGACAATEREPGASRPTAAAA